MESTETALAQYYVEQITPEAEMSYHVRLETRQLDIYVAILEGK